MRTKFNTHYRQTVQPSLSIMSRKIKKKTALKTDPEMKDLSTTNLCKRFFEKAFVDKGGGESKKVAKEYRVF